MDEAMFDDEVSCRRSCEKLREWQANRPTVVLVDQTLVDFQNRNCRGCFFDEDNKAGTGQACCTYNGAVELADGVCQVRRRHEVAEAQAMVGLGNMPDEEWKSLYGNYMGRYDLLGRGDERRMVDRKSGRVFAAYTMKGEAGGEAK
jgi:hypothetical protein